MAGANTLDHGVEETSPRLTGIGSVAALALAVAALVSFGAGDATGFRSDSAERIFVLTWLLGWVLLAWAVVVAVGSLVALIRRARTRRPVSPFELALLSACFTLVVLAMSMHPLWGAGSGSGT